MLTSVAQRTISKARFAVYAHPQTSPATQPLANELASPWAAFVTALLRSLSTAGA